LCAEITSVVDAERRDVDRDLARRLHRVALDAHAARARARAAISATGWITPVSLFASITAPACAGRGSVDVAGSSEPRASTGRCVDAEAVRASTSAAPCTAWCSIAEIAIARPRVSSAQRLPISRAWSPSVPPLVNVTASARADQRRHLSRARARPRRARAGPAMRARRIGAGAGQRLGHGLARLGAHRVDALWSK
jgi:hypothetical protein